MCIRDSSTLSSRFCIIKQPRAAMMEEEKKREHEWLLGTGMKSVLTMYWAHFFHGFLYRPCRALWWLLAQSGWKRCPTEWRKHTHSQCQFLLSTAVGLSYHGAEPSGIANVSNMEDKVNVVHLLFNHARGVEGVWLYVLDQKEAAIFLTTSHVYCQRNSAFRIFFVAIVWLF